MRSCPRAREACGAVRGTVQPRLRHYRPAKASACARSPAAINAVAAEQETCLIRLNLGWPADMTRYNHPLDYLGGDGGGGIGAGPGLAVGAALALRGTGRLPLAVLGDGDFIMGVSALWTATHARIPLLIVIANNRSFFNDEMHQERMARLRGRPVENRWIGQRMDEPGIDLAAMARAQGAIALGPVTSARRPRAGAARCRGEDPGRRGGRGRDRWSGGVRRDDRAHDGARDRSNGTRVAGSISELEQDVFC